MNILCLSRQKGQAMTEMLVASAFVLVPLFLIVPMLGKYIDMQHATVTGARYVAWERTVKLPDSDRDDYQPSDYDKTATPYISKLNLAAGMKTKLLSESGQLNASDNLGRKLWAYHDGTRILSDISVTDVDTGQSVHGVLAPVVGVFGDVLAGITTVLTLGSNTFDVINTNGVSNATVSMQTTSAPGFTSLSKDPEDKLIQTNALTFKASAQVYTLSWSAGGSDHLADKVTPLAPTAILSNHIEKATDTLKSYIPVPIPSSVTAQNIISVALLSPEIDDDELRFGHMDMSILPRDKYLETDRETKKYDDDINDLLNGDLCNSKGYCRDE